MRRGTPGRTAPLAAAILLLAGCATAPSAIGKMDAAAIAAVPDADLCFAVAHGKRVRQSFGLAETEQARRGLTCETQVARVISDCSMLRIGNPDAQPLHDENAPNPEWDVITYAVSNSSDTRRQFRIGTYGYLSRLQTIGPSQTTRLSIPVPQGRAPMMAARRAQDPQRNWVVLQDCTVPY
jgi:hypothetical protein